jgi:hypothetical protein
MDEAKDQLESRKLEHKIEIENRESENIWQASCLKLDRRCLIFVNQVMFGLLLTSFCMIQLSQDKSTEEKMVYLTMLSSTMGIFLPSPSLKKD